MTSANSQFLVGLDLGGSAARAVVLDVTTGVVHAARRSHPMRTAPGTGGLGSDLDLPAIRDGLAAATREAIARAGASPDAVLGIAATAMRLGTILLDASGEAVLAVPNRDARAVGPGLLLAARHGAAINAVTGRWPFPIFAAARLQWLAENDPQALERARHYLSVSDWMTWYLCGEITAERSQAGESLLFDQVAQTWSDPWIEQLEIPRRLFPELVPCGTRVGGLTRGTAEALGLRAGTPVSVGGADTQCGLLGAGALRPDDVAVVAGTTAPVQLVLDRAVIDPEARVWTGQHVAPGRFVLESNAGPVGDTLEWLARILHPDAPPHLGGTAMLLGEAAEGEPGARGILSTLGVEVMNAKSRGIPIGNLTLSHMPSESDPAPRRHLARSIVEGIACGLRANIEQLREIASASPGSPVRLAGGLSRSALCARVLANVLGAPVHVPAVFETTGFGAVLCAAVGAGLCADLESAARDLVPAPTVVDPDPDAAEAHRQLYERWTAFRAERLAADTSAAASITPFVLQGAARADGAPAASVRPKILVTADCDPTSLAALERLGDVTYASYRDERRMLTGPALVETLAGVQIFVTEIDLVDADALDQLPDLRVIVSCRGDAVNVDVDACTAFGIPMLRTPGRNADAVADLTLAFLLMLARKLPDATRFLSGPDIAAGDMGKMGQAFGRFRGRELWRKTVGLVGLGAIGSKVCERLAGFGARILVTDPYVTPERAATLGAESVSLDELLRESDFVSLHAAVTPETTGLLAAAEFAAMKPTACLVNTARAALLDEDDLVAALTGGTIAGAALDTFAVEPPGSDHPLMSLDNVIATPHVGGNTEDVAAHQGGIVVDELSRLLAGTPPRFAANPDVLETFAWDAPRPRPDAETLARLREGPAPAVSDLQKKEKARTPRAAAATAAPPTPPAPTPRTAGPGAGGMLPDAVARGVRELCAAFVERICADDAMRAFSRGRQVTLHFTLEDAACDFYFKLADGVVSGSEGPPERVADVQLRMRADVLDGMFTGRANPMEAAMEGRLAFTGDAAKAMTLQHLQDDLQRLYSAAREAVGDPGDLTASEAASLAVPLAAGDVREELVEIVQELYAGQVITATGGNVSVRIPGEDALWITPSQLFKGDLRPEVLVRIDLAGRSLDAGARSPSSEWDMHCAVLRAKPEARAVVHAHAPHATILANAGLPFLPISTEAAFFGDIPRVPFIMPGTPELAEAVSDGIRDGWAVLMINHGIVVAGRTLRRAADMVEIIERSAEVILGCYAVGREPPTLPAEVVKQLREMGDLVA